MFKNIEKYGLSKDFDGKYQFTARVINPLQNKEERGLGAIALASDKLKNTAVKEKKVKKTEPVEDIQSNKGKHKVEAFVGGYGTGGVGSSYGMTGASITSVTPYIGVLEGIIPEDDWTTKRRIYKDIYTYDLAGAVVDLISTLPYSDFNLIGINDPAIIEGYVNAIENLHLTDLMPAITTDYLVNGAFVGSLNWDTTNSKFTSLLPHHLDDCEIHSLGLIGVDPIINLTLDPNYMEVLSNKQDPRVQRLMRILPDYIKKGMTGGQIELNPVTTMYIPRRGLTDPNAGGSSYFNRIITIHLMEKALIKGTIEVAQRRQMPIMHVQAGNEDWQPTNQELAELASYFLSADLDPISGIVVTRDGVNISDAKRAQDLWSWGDIFSFSTDVKMRALGVNDAILSGDASFNTMEASISAFMDNVSNTRDIITSQVFYNKIFPIVAYQNNYRTLKQDSQTVLASNIGIRVPNYKITQRGEKVIGHVVRADSSLFELGDLSQYAIPTVQWSKQLKPKADKEYLELLTSLKDLGVPIALRAFAAAGGENIDDLVAAMDDDNDMRLEIADKYKDLVDDAVQSKTQMFIGMDNIQEVIQAQQEQAMGGDTYDQTYAKLASYAKENQGIIDTKHKFRNLADADNIYGVREYDSNGHRRILTAERKIQLENKIHKQIAQAIPSAIEKEAAKEFQ